MLNFCLALAHLQERDDQTISPGGVNTASSGGTKGISEVESSDLRLKLGFVLFLILFVRLGATGQIVGGG